MGENPLWEEQVWNREEDGFFVDASRAGVTPSASNMKRISEMLSGLDENKLMAALTAPEEEIEKDSDSLVAVKEGAIAPSVERMPSNIRAMMFLAEGYDLLEGDVHEILNVPIDLGLTDITVDCADPGVKKLYEDLFTALNMQEMVENNWLYCNTHGQSYPLQIWDENVPQSITHLDPKTVIVGNPMGFGPRSMSLGDAVLKKRLVSEDKALKSIGEEADAAFEKQLGKQQYPMIVFNSFGRRWNDFGVYGDNIPLNPEYITHLHLRKWPHTRYAIPPIVRAYRSLVTRERLEEMVLATIEGVKNQLWLFTKERFARGEAAALDSVLSESRGDHLGYLIWPDLEVKQFVPGSIDQLLAPEKWFELTRHIFRQLGISMYVVSGELPGGTRSNPEIDVRLLMLRLESDRRRQLKWLREFAAKFAAKNGIKEEVTIGFRLNTFDQEDLIKNTLAPLATFGQISSHTFLQEVGYIYDQERAYKEKELPHKYLFMPMQSFSQVSTDSGGNVKTTDSQGQKGRTPDAQNPEQMMKASIEDYQVAISRSYKDVKDAEDNSDREKAIAAFIASLIMSNIHFMNEAYVEGYRSAGGTGEPSRERVDAVAALNDQYAENFRDDMLEAMVAEETFPDFEWRANLYAPAGWQRAWMAGIFQAKKEQGMTGWQRVLHPESSESGPCPDCLSDAGVIHSIDEEFTDHPHGVCTAKFVTFYRGRTSTMPTRIPALEYPVPRVSGR